ncbi:MAG: MaoC family dehydratase [Pseudomonadota bacterium]
MSHVPKRTVEELEALVGQEMGVSRWFEVTQDRIDKFADVTEDWQYIHLDPERAAAETPFGGAIAHGFLTVSLLSAMVYEAGPGVKGIKSSVNYGFDKLRFISPVKAGARIRGRFTLTKFDTSKPGEVTYHQNVVVEIEGEEKPALVCDWIGRVYI